MVLLSHVTSILIEVYILWRRGGLVFEITFVPDQGLLSSFLKPGVQDPIEEIDRRA